MLPKCGQNTLYQIATWQTTINPTKKKVLYEGYPWQLKETHEKMWNKNKHLEAEPRSNTSHALHWGRNITPYEISKIKALTMARKLIHLITKVLVPVLILWERERERERGETRTKGELRDRNSGEMDFDSNLGSLQHNPNITLCAPNTKLCLI